MASGPASVGALFTVANQAAVAFEKWVGVKGVGSTAVANTNSMLPALDENCVLLVDYPEFGELTVGDIVIFRTPANGWAKGRRCCHRIVDTGKRGFVTKGDASPRYDPDPLTAEAFESRVIGVLYGARDADTDL